MPAIRFITVATFCQLLLLCCSALATADETLQVSPERVVLNSSRELFQLLVSSEGNDVTQQASYQSSHPEIATVDARGSITSQAAGEAKITVTMGDASVEVPLVVNADSGTRQVNFRTDIQPLLSRHGCNSGGCHGKASGQNGFKLSLFGFDTEFDYGALVHEARGRRIDLAAPERSLLLTKSIGSVPHGGGKRIETGSDAYEMMLAWIQNGAPRPTEETPRVVEIQIEPAERILQPGALQQLRVTANYTDGTTRDVTRNTDYGSNVDVVATVDEQGGVTAGEQSGEATIMARYMGQVAVFRAIRPHGAPLAELPEFEPRNGIDRLAAEKWKKLGLRPSPPCDDATFIRRVTLDLTGRLPTVDEVRAFLADESPDKRSQLVDRLLDSPDYPAYFALKWSAILRNSRLAGADQAAYAFHNWIRDNIARNRPYDEFVRGIVAASGEWQDAPAINWYWQSRDDQLHMVTADTAQLFLGIRLQCARCHHHPYERWGQEDYFGLAGFYARLGRKSFGQPPPYYNSSKNTTGERNPLTNQPPTPRYPDGEEAEFSPEQDPRHGLVDWMSQPENPFFAKAFVNRMWGHFFSIGLVNEVDDMRETNPPSNPELLDYLAEEFVTSKFDMRHIVRLITTSRLYELSSAPRPENEYDNQNFARFYARRLIAEVLLDAVDGTCETKSNFGNISFNARAVDLPHEGFGSYFMDTFDRPQRVSVCECERSPGATLAQVLLMSTSDEMENKIADGNGRLARLFKEETPVPTVVEELYLAAFARFPSAEERQVGEDYLNSAEDKRKAAEDLLWTILNSREFVFNH
ncbi:MAG: DUF1549 domain-containing protein [Planctomycetaceae bacterium]|nr:DUF1549 domain-containing protein [Planctomycetaceae bacterium]